MKNKQTDKSLVFLDEWVTSGHVLPTFLICGLFLISLLPAFLHFSFFRLFSCQYRVWKVGRQVSLRFINLSVVERLKGRLLAQEVQEHLHPHGAFFSLQNMAVVSGTSSLEQRPAWEHAGAHWITVFLDDKWVFFLFCLFVLYRRWSGNTLIIHWF